MVVKKRETTKKKDIWMGTPRTLRSGPGPGRSGVGAKYHSGRMLVFRWFWFWCVVVVVVVVVTLVFKNIITYRLYVER